MNIISTYIIIEMQLLCELGARLNVKSKRLHCKLYRIVHSNEKRERERER